MKFRLYDDFYYGTPEQIVEKMRSQDHGFPKTVDDHMMRVLERSPSYKYFVIEGETVATRCESFLNGLVQLFDAAFCI